MIEPKRKLTNFVIVFSIIELILGILVQITDGKLNTAVSFLAILLACAFSSLLYTKTKEYVLTQIALVCTVFADLFLVVITPQYRELAMVFFSCTQICYFLRIYLGQTEKKQKLAHLVSRGIVVLVALMLTAIILKEKTDFLSLISLFYYANLVMNVIFAFTQAKKSLAFAIGLLFFALCDLFIGFGVLGDSYIELKEGSFLYWISNPGFKFAWIFYVPSQALLSLSLVKKRLETVK